MQHIISTPHAPAAIGPYSQAVQYGELLFISGQIPINPETGEIVKGLENQVHQVMKNLKAVLEAGGKTFDNVLKATIYLQKMSDFQVVNEIYASYFSEGKYPARETVAVLELPKNVPLEISVIVG